MNWLKQVVVDLLITGVILITALQNLPGLEILLAIYTALLLFIKLFCWLNEGILKRLKRGATAAPDWFYHVLHAANVVLLAGTQRWAMGLTWLSIWLVSWLISRKLQSLRSSSSVRQR